MANYYNPQGRDAHGATQQQYAPQHPHSSNPPRTDSLEPPQLGATFVPGGFDDYYMPEVYAPSPQRIMPEVPQNMQDDIQRLESGARSAEFHTVGEPTQTSTLPGGGYTSPPPAAAPPALTTLPAAPAKATPDHPPSLPKPSTISSDAPTFSPFPKVKGDGIPPSFEEIEQTLWDNREHTLHSNNVTLQLEWAKQVLSWVEVIMEEQDRELDGKPRPPTPNAEHQMRIDALTIINHLAGQEHPDALFLRSKWLEFGKFGHRIDKREAYNGYKRAAELGMGRAEYRMGMLFEASNDMRNAIQHYQRGLDLGDSAASYRLGMMSLMGQHGQIKDYHHGLSLIEAAADSADEDAPQGAYVYGLLIARELPDITIPEGLLPYQLPLAKRYIEKAALLGFAKAQLKMGQAYELCQLGCDFNPSFSLHYYGLAAKQGQAEAALGVSRWFLFGYEGFFNKNEQLAFKYAKQAADGKLATGEFAMGYYNEIGIHVAKDVREAKRWYELAAEHGNKDALGRLESLNEQKTLTKHDHETTTLTRIKSQHGSMRGKRPERFAKKASAMPSVSEGDAEQPQPGVSPRVSPGMPPTGNAGGTDVPDVSRLSIKDARQPAFALNVEGASDKPKPSAPYPEDDRPPPLNLARAQSAAPYPEDDTARPPLSPHFDPKIRPSQGPTADRPMSAFGIRPLSPGAPGGRPPQANLGPGGDQRGRLSGAGWEPQVPNDYRQASPGPQPMGDYRRDPYRQDLPRPATTQPYDGRQGGPGANPAQNRLQKPYPQGQRPVSSMAGNQYPGPQGPREPAQPGRDFGPRTSSRPSLPGQPQLHRPVSEAYPSYGRGGPGPNPAGRPDRFDSLPAHPSPQQTHGGPRPVSHIDRPRPLDDGPGRVGSAPPVQQRPQQQQQRPSSPAASTASAPPRPTGQGPATFEEMGIPQGKNEGDCLEMQLGGM
ncbi:hypothetical protein SAPIO_CDS1783 [Scedosporium apiospermum]|uniref:Uncharacterized protein n=1 Tax=Pseudallescheria apiosperma TaxID=563466 RepID=A0A084GDQ6_PSEDA|nr:uncharacterized protein SAPIO_CDS1783 [Scedosporium apiospermum]KEZ45468.1 hypothetical protein SAPIO_CDS1783 [Scedosporium apiospermum]